MYEERFYRDWATHDALHRFDVKIEESDLLVLSDVEDREGATRVLRRVRGELENYISIHPAFASSLEPVEVFENAAEIVRDMAEAGEYWNVGPMAAVAGAVAAGVGRYLMTRAETVVVENGGDIFATANRSLRFALYAGEVSPFAGKLAFELDATGGIGVCTSSGRVGPSLSLGRADAVVAIHSSPSFADAAATSIANRIQHPDDISRVVDAERERGALDGLIACMDDKMGLWGDLELMKR